MTKIVSSIAALTLVAGGAHLVTTTTTASASPSCTPEVVEDGSLLYAQVYDAKPIKNRPDKKRVVPKWIAGAKMYVPAEKGMTREYLNRAAICHAKASEAPSYANDPLRVDGRIDGIRVYPAGGAFVIAVTSEDKATGREIWKRADALTREVDADLAKRADTPQSDF